MEECDGHWWRGDHCPGLTMGSLYQCSPDWHHAAPSPSIQLLDKPRIREFSDSDSERGFYWAVAGWYHLSVSAQSAEPVTRVSRVPGTFSDVSCSKYFRDNGKEIFECPWYIPLIFLVTVGTLAAAISRPVCLGWSARRGAGEKASWHHQAWKVASLSCLLRARLPSISRLQCRQREQQPYLSVTPSKHHPHQPQPDSQQLEQAHKSLFGAVF